ncbi:MAG TPA: lipocalin family protein [Nevskia sp.]|nr:lipocalin family protein [Nevskia sp.]
MNRNENNGIMRRAWRAAGLAALALAAACAAPAEGPQPLTVAPAVDAQKLGGQWYLIAHVPYAEERDQADSSIELRAREDGGYDEIYRYFDSRLMQSVARQRARYQVVAGSNNARWIDHSRALDTQMELGVLYVDPAYRYAVVGESGRRLGWIYARDPGVDAGTYAMLLARLDRQGYDVAQLHRLGHSQIQVGQPRFAVP